VATPGLRLVRRIAHFDLDTFFVSVERVRDPSLAGKPVLVGHPGGRGVVASASYESRAFGCRSAQPMTQALRRCPQAIVIRPHFELYRDVSRQFHAILADATPLVESVGLDEAYADLTGIEPLDTGAREAAQRVRSRVRAELSLPLSACIAGSRTTAKVGRATLTRSRKSPWKAWKRRKKRSSSGVRGETIANCQLPIANCLLSRSDGGDGGDCDPLS